MKPLATSARWLGYGVLLYLIALHTSMAAMEILAWILCLLEIYHFARIRSFPSFRDWKPIAGLTFCVVIGLIINPLGRPFFFQVGFLRWAILLYLLPSVLAETWNPKFERRLVLVWVGICSLCAVYALFQTFTGIDLVRPNAHVVSFAYGVWRPVGFFSRSLAFAYSFGFSFLAISFAAWKHLPRWSVIIFYALGVATIVATEARGAWFGILTALFIYLLMEHRRYLVGCMAVASAAIFGLSQLQNEVGIKINNMLAMTVDHSSSMRLHLWSAYFQMWKEHPFFGVGLLQGDLLVPTYYKQLGIQEEFVSNAHNVYLQWLAGAGVFALLCYLWLSFSFLRRAWNLRKLSPWGWSILIAQVFLHVGAFTENNFFTAITNHMVVFNWSILLVLDAAEDPNSQM